MTPIKSLRGVKSAAYLSIAASASLKPAIPLRRQQETVCASSTSFARGDARMDGGGLRLSQI